MEMSLVSICIFIFLLTLNQGDACSIANWNPLGLAARLHEAENVIIGNVTVSHEGIASNGFEYRYLMVDVSCVLKDTQSLSIKNTLEIRERVLRICHLHYDLITDGDSMMLFRYDAGEDVYEFHPVNYEAPQVRASASSVAMALGLCGFQNPYVPADAAPGTNPCTATTTTQTCVIAGGSAAPTNVMIIIAATVFGISFSLS